MDNIAVLIPCYNESVSIEKTVLAFREALPDAVIYVYDNNSSDGTDEIARRAGAVVRYERKQGKGNVIRRMFREIDAKCYVMVDGDDTYPAENAPEMVKHVLENGADMVIGDRLSSTYFSENKRAFHGIGNSFVRKSINSIFKSDVKDIMTGYRAMSYLFVKTFPVLSKGFEIETEMTIHSIDKNMQLVNVVVDYRDRAEGSVSKLNTVSDGIKVVKTVGNLFKNYRPFKFFATIALVLAAVSLGFFIPIFIHFIETGRVPNLPTLVVCCFVALAAIQSFFSGLILQTLIHRSKGDFETKLYQADCEYKRLIASDSKANQL